MAEIASPIPLTRLVTAITVPPERAQVAIRPRPVPVVVEERASTLARSLSPVRARVAAGVAVACGLFAAGVVAGYAGLATHLLGALVGVLGAVAFATLVVLAAVSRHRQHCPGCPR
jgi:hypothetical protein